MKTIQKILEAKYDRFKGKIILARDRGQNFLAEAREIARRERNNELSVSLDCAGYYTITGPFREKGHEVGSLHELIHVEMAETAHPLFGSQSFPTLGRSENDGELFRSYSLVTDTATNWFVENQLIDEWPAAIERIEEIYRRFKLGKFPDDWHKLSLLLAIYERHMGRLNQLSPEIRQYVNAFHGVSPEPCIGNLMCLINTLCSLDGLPLLAPSGVGGNRLELTGYE